MSFRHGGGGTSSPPGPSTPLKHQTSVDKLLKHAVDSQTPSRRKQHPSDLPEDLSEMVQRQNDHGREDSGATIIFGTLRGLELMKRLAVAEGLWVVCVESALLENITRQRVLPTASLIPRLRSKGNLGNERVYTFRLRRRMPLLSLFFRHQL